MSSTTAPITASIMFPFIAAPERCVSARRPGLVIAGRPGPVPAAEDRPGRAIGARGPGQVRLVRLFPFIPLAIGRHRVGRVMQPGVPFRRNLGPLGLAPVDYPAPLAAPASSPGLQLSAALHPVIAVAIRIAADQLAAQH